MNHPLVRKDISIHDIVKNDENPNKMSSRQFDLLVQNMQDNGITENIVVRETDEGKFRIVSGHHRFDAAVYIGYEKVPTAVITDPDFDQEEEDMLLVKMNMIKGKLDAQAFFSLYNKYAAKYGDAALQDAFGFSDEAEWKRLINQTAKALPDKETQKKFKEAAKEIKTIDGLTELLNMMFTQYGDTLPYSYMVIDYGGQKSFWLRASQKTYKHAETLGHLCIEKDVTLDDVMAGVLEHLTSSKGGELLNEVMESAPKVELPKGLVGVPTKDKLDTMKGNDDGTSSDN